MEIKQVTVHRCPRCGGVDLKKNGHADNGAQRARCKSEGCGKTFVLEPKGPRHSPEDKERVLRAYRERMSTRAIYRTFGVSYPTLMRWAGEKNQGATGA